MTLAIVCQELTNSGVHRVVIRDIEEVNPIDNLSEGFTTIKYKKNPMMPFMEDVAREVKMLTKKKQKKFKKLITVSLGIILPFISTEMASAQTMDFPMVGGGGNEFLPPEIMKILVQLILALGIFGVLLAMGALMAVGAYRMVGNQSKAVAWSKNIIGGLGQVLLAPVIILILTSIVVLLFGNIPQLSIFYRH